MEQTLKDLLDELCAARVLTDIQINGMATMNTLSGRQVAVSLCRDTGEELGVIQCAHEDMPVQLGAFLDELEKIKNTPPDGE